MFVIQNFTRVSFLVLKMVIVSLLDLASYSDISTTFYKQFIFELKSPRLVSSSAADESLLLETRVEH